MDIISYALALKKAKAYTDTSVAAIPRGLVYKGTVSTVADLPVSGNTKGDLYTVTANGHEYIWTIDATSGTTANWLDLNSDLDNLPGYLGEWNCGTGKPVSLASGHVYKAGDWFKATNVITELTNKCPSGSTYSGAASTTVETNTQIALNDIYYYDGSAWHLGIIHSTVTDSEKVTWNAKYSKPADGIPDSDIANATVWNAKYDKPAAGIPDSDIASATTWNGKADVFIATFNTTTYAQVLAAYNAGKICFVDYSENDHVYRYQLTETDEDDAGNLRFHFSAFYDQEYSGECTCELEDGETEWSMESCHCVTTDRLASADQTGIVKIGSGINVSNGVISVTQTPEYNDYYIPLYTPTNGNVWDTLSSNYDVDVYPADLPDIPFTKAKKIIVQCEGFMGGTNPTTSGVIYARASIYVDASNHEDVDITATDDAEGTAAWGFYAEGQRMAMKGETCGSHVAEQAGMRYGTSNLYFNYTGYDGIHYIRDLIEGNATIHHIHGWIQASSAKPTKAGAYGLHIRLYY